MALLAELHVHLEGTVRRETALELASRHRAGPPPPYEYSDLAGFLDVYWSVSRCLRDAEDFERIVLEHAQVMAAQSIAYAEVSFNPTLHQGTDWLAGLESGRAQAAARHGVEIAWLVELSRGAGVEVNSAALDIGRGLSGVVGVGLVGDESIPAAPLAELFANARAAGLGVMPHCGQGPSAAAIREAIDVLGADRLAHGVAAASDPALLAAVADRGILLCVCPSSNRKIGLQPDFAGLAEAGVLMTANTDDPTMVGTSLAVELEALAVATGVTTGELAARAWAGRFGT